MAETSLKEDITAAFDKMEQEAPEPAAAPAPAPEPEQLSIVVPETPIGEPPEQPEAKDKDRDEKGRFVKQEAKPAEPVKAPEQPKVEAPKPAAPVPEKPPQKEVQAPKSMAAPLREAWKNLDQTARDYLLKREGEIARLNNETTEARKHYDAFRNTFQPFEPLFRAEGVDVLTGLGNLTRAVAVLATGNQDAKADLMANLIQRYGVDIQRLDSRLAGQATQTQMPQYQQPSYTLPPDQFRDPRVDAMLQQANARLEQQAAAQLSEVENNEFYEDVRDTMADILEVASKRGIDMGAEEAYNRAIALDPYVSKVIEQRKNAATAETTQRSMVAASSVRGQPTAAPNVSKQGQTLRDDIEAAWDMKNASRR